MLANLDLNFFGVYPNAPAESRFWNSEFSTLYAWDSIGTSSFFKRRNTVTQNLDSSDCEKIVALKGHGFSRAA